MENNINNIIDLFNNISELRAKEYLLLNNNNVEQTINYILVNQLNENNQQEQEQKQQQQHAEQDENEKLFKEFMKNEQAEIEKGYQKQKHSCSICFDDLTIDQFYIVDECEHRFCIDCLRGHYEAQIRSRFPDIKCPHITCKKIITYEEVKHILSAEMFKRYDELLFENLVRNDKNCIYCPNSDCGIIMSVNQDHDLRIDCPNLDCAFSFCIGCRNEWHEGLTCKEWLEVNTTIQECSIMVKNDMDYYNHGVNNPFINQDYLKTLTKRQRKKYLKNFKRNIHDRSFFNNLIKRDGIVSDWIRLNLKICPHCTALVEKIDGCNDVRCICGNHFCFGCSKSIEDHGQYYNYPCYPY
ncbi:hypothetical protein CYY_002688 [Polysphondylium violaceum]|uniref:RBR-type E3 ubiquitin transferase n=1 Tax=Polysphondylium violaceum TaxID=133409 RepID=A0A8J4PXS3_9MYCE|nr:hypothetical protein CYY_002688 [Polysphondylium violaceum]